MGNIYIRITRITIDLNLAKFISQMFISTDDESFKEKAPQLLLYIYACYTYVIYKYNIYITCTHGQHLIPWARIYRVEAL